MAVVVIEGLTELRSALRELDDKLGGRPLRAKEIDDAYKAIAKGVQAAARRRARAMGGVHAKAAMGITGKWDDYSARIQVKPTKRAPMARTAFWGAERRTGWYGASKYDRSRGTQHPRWVGNQWDVGDPKRGPYAINQAIDDELDAVMVEFSKAIDEMAKRTAWRWAGGGWSGF